MRLLVRGVEIVFLEGVVFWRLLGSGAGSTFFSFLWRIVERGVGAEFLGMAFSAVPSPF